MRRYGRIDEIDFIRQGFDIYSLAIKYKLISYDSCKYVYANNMSELKKEIIKFRDEENEQRI